MKTCLCALILSGWGAHALADTALTEGNANVICTYSHRLADDAILYPGKPGQAMQHDFFGNVAANGNSTADSLLAQPASTCENVADSTAYWVPTLRLANGQIISPMYQKTYYTNTAPPGPGHYPTVGFPVGLQMLAGNHMGVAPNPNISFLCTGRGYTQTAPTACVPDPVNGTQFNIGISFPTCWDGVNLAPKVMINGYNNMAYADTTGACPAGYPVRVPHVSLNVAYNVGQVRDLSGAQLSMDPAVDATGKVTQLNWGSIYSAHGDFFNGWQPQAAQYMAEYCFNKNRDCGRAVAYSYTEASADAFVAGGTHHASNTGSAPTLTVQAALGDTPKSVIYLKFNIPAGAERFGTAFTPVYRLSLYGGNATSTDARTIYFYNTADTWDEHSITLDNAPACGSKAGSLYLDNAKQYRDADVSAAVKAALQAGKTQISFCVQGGGDGNAFNFDSKDSGNKPVLYLYGDNPI